MIGKGFGVWRQLKLCLLSAQRHSHHSARFLSGGFLHDPSALDSVDTVCCKMLKHARAGRADAGFSGGLETENMLMLAGALSGLVVLLSLVNAFFAQGHRMARSHGLRAKQARCNVVLRKGAFLESLPGYSADRLINWPG